MRVINCSGRSWCGVISQKPLRNVLVTLLAESVDNYRPAESNERLQECVIYYYEGHFKPLSIMDSLLYRDA
ncbi:hypothetical protein CEXT_656001 [Caerostris extrusa]|uniref:Uncharacterized protein n=1 Tax=Caerostris extrusa TaxID=172846 RepID=A0AAV4YDP1_CAEEX|nr:hypothetical protein CEXT_656001 [Caerostris extrusa]